MNPKVSVVIPAYNVEKYIDYTIQSVVDQTYKNWEIIIINDGSKDNTGAKIEAWLDKDFDIKYFPIKNGGVSNARNIGIENATGDYIAFLDSDDVWKKDNLSKKVDVLDKHQEIDWTFSDMINADEFMNEIGLAETGTDEDMLNNILAWEREVVPGPASNVIVRRKCFDEGIKYDVQFSTAADQDFCLQLSKNYKAKRINEGLWSYRIIGTSMSRNITVMEKDHIGVYQKAKRNGLFHSKSFEKKCFSNLYYIIGMSWIINEKSYLRGTKFLLKSIMTEPSRFFKILKKLF